MHAVVLCAGLGKRLAPYTEARPKCLFEVHGTTLLERHVAHLRSLGVSAITVVTGHLEDMVRAEAARVAPAGLVRIVRNEAYRRGSIVSLARGLEGVVDDVVFMDADVLYHPDVLGRLLRSSHRSSVLVDTGSTESGEEMMIGVRDGRARMIARRVSHAGPWDVSGESVGFFRVAKESVGALRESIDSTITKGGEDQEYEASLNVLFERTPVGFERVDDLAWTEIDFAEDLQRAREKIAPLLPPLPPEAP